MSTLRTYNVQSSDSASTNIQLTENGGIIVAGIITATGGIDITGGDVTLTNNLLIPEDKKIHLEGGSGDDYNAIWKADAENTVFVTSRFNMANIIDSNNDDSIAYWSVRKDGTTLAGSDELMRVQSDGNVGIGTDSPQAVLHAYHPTTNTIINVESGDAGAVLNLIDPSQRSSIEQNGTTLKIISDTGAEFASSDIRLQVDGGTVMRAESTGNVKIDNGNLVFSTAGTGIDFSATSDTGGMTSELLDDYEEGTFTAGF